MPSVRLYFPPGVGLSTQLSCSIMAPSVMHGSLKGVTGTPMAVKMGVLLYMSSAGKAGLIFIRREGGEAWVRKGGRGRGHLALARTGKLLQICMAVPYVPLDVPSVQQRKAVRKGTALGSVRAGCGTARTATALLAWEPSNLPVR